MSLSDLALDLAFCEFSATFRPHRSTAYLDAACCYRPSSDCSVVCRSVTLVSPAKVTELIKMPFGFRSLVGPGNYVLDVGPEPP